MRDHPLTPMTDANLVRVLARQTTAAVGLVACPTIDAGIAAVTHRFGELRAEGVRYAILDAIRDEHLVTLGAACRDLPLTTGGAGLAMGIARALGARAEQARRSALRDAGRRAALLAGAARRRRAPIAAAGTYARAVPIDPVRSPTTHRPWPRW
jgi:uncharacterized protein YgbK (DUF1537 family)